MDDITQLPNQTLDCSDELQQNPGSVSGEYIRELPGQWLCLYCDMETDDGGWTVRYYVRINDDSCSVAFEKYEALVVVIDILF